MKVIDVKVRDKGVKRSINGAGPRIKVEYAMIVKLIHIIFDSCFRPSFAAVEIKRFHRAHFIQVEGGETVAFCSSEVTAGTFDPQYFDALASQRVFLH